METEGKIRVLLCRPGSPPQIEWVQNEFDTLRDLIKSEQGDLVEYVRLDGKFELVCNEEGRFQLPPNCFVPGMAPQFNEQDFSFVMKPENAAPPGSLGLYETWGTWILAKSTNRASHDLESLTDEDIQFWQFAIKLVTSLITS